MKKRNMRIRYLAVCVTYAGSVAVILFFLAGAALSLLLQRKFMDFLFCCPVIFVVALCVTLFHLPYNEWEKMEKDVRKIW
jgi:uncharacterized membrane protein YoaK (UPF0700 family)